MEEVEGRMLTFTPVTEQSVSGFRIKWQLDETEPTCSGGCDAAVKIAELKNTVLPVVTNYFFHALKVVPRTTDIVIPNNFECIGNTWTTGSTYSNADFLLLAKTYFDNSGSIYAWAVPCAL